MTDDSVPEADGPNLAERLRSSHASSEGGRPIRKRGFHRALRRGASWAVLQQGMADMMNRVYRDLYLNTAKRASPWVSTLEIVDGSKKPEET